MDQRNRSSNDRLIASYLRAFASGVPTQVSAHVSDDFVNAHLGALGAGCEGKSVYEARLAKFLTDFEDLRYDVEDICSNDVQGSARYVMRFRQNGKDFAVPGMMFFNLANGKIAKRTDCWDSLVYLKQAGTDAASIDAMLRA